MAQSMNVLDELLKTLPPERLSDSCTDGDFTCDHWVHTTLSPGNVVVSDDFYGFLSIAAETKGTG